MVQADKLDKLNFHVVQSCCGNEEGLICATVYYIRVSNYLSLWLLIRYSAYLLAFCALTQVFLSILIHFFLFLFQPFARSGSKMTHLGCA
jgi:hypothetical protein